MSAAKSRRGRPRPTVTIDEELVHDVIEVLDQVTYSGSEGPRLDSRGRVVWGEEIESINVEEIFALGQRLRQIFTQREIDRAVAAALASRGPVLVTGSAVRR